ncbi:Rv3654c family TadE-like protein [Cryobacterium psychrotolerans]|uniref:Rv3654c family TadE-like protein n=1 Tax=Cryobacterium psychrotolerans TaxID=386301 RepID=UPI001F543B1B|nr:Rv3654c family TadE-like protein [Cryobacterium psychrotolerans]
MTVRPVTVRPVTVRPLARRPATRRPVRGSERGAGGVLAVALIGATLTVTLLGVPLLALLAVGQSVQNAADAAALAAADTASGAVAGFPCTAAAEAAALNGASVVTCTLDGLISSVTVARTVAGFALTSSARAGPPA